MEAEQAAMQWRPAAKSRMTIIDSGLLGQHVCDMLESFLANERESNASSAQNQRSAYFASITMLQPAIVLIA